MSSILEKIKSEKQKTRAKINIAIDSELKSKIEYICKVNGINLSVYLEQILENSEIGRVYNKTKKEQDVVSSEDIIDESKSHERV